MLTSISFETYVSLVYALIMIKRRDTSRRRERIVALLREQGSVQIPALAQILGVSTQTLRKDLNFLDRKRICTRSTGGAILHSGAASTTEDAIDVKRTLFASEKVSIGRRAAALISDGESVLLDSGTTTLQVARHLNPEDSLVVVTNDVGIMNELTGRDSVQLVFLGGTLRRKSLSFYGSQTERTVRDLHVDKLFLAADGFDTEKGITTHFEPEAQLNRMMCAAAKEIIVVTDSSKFGRLCLHSVLEPQGISKVVTDAGIPVEAREALARSGVEVIVV
jgi:DeoR family transcriptional regulator of aga operon